MAHPGVIVDEIVVGNITTVNEIVSAFYEDYFSKIEYILVEIDQTIVRFRHELDAAIDKYNQFWQTPTLELRAMYATNNEEQLERYKLRLDKHCQTRKKILPLLEHLEEFVHQNSKLTNGELVRRLQQVTQAMQTAISDEFVKETRLMSFEEWFTASLNMKQRHVDYCRKSLTEACEERVKSEAQYAALVDAIELLESNDQISV